MIEVTEPFQISRVADYFKSSGYSFTTDDDGDIYISFKHHNFAFSATGEHRQIYAIRSVWRVVAPIEARGRLLELSNDWNRDTLWPKTYVTVNDDGEVRVHGEVNIELSVGVTDKQLEQFTDYSVISTIQFFDSLDREFPDTRFES